MRKEIQRLADELAEKRSDISDILERILDGQKWSPKDIEHRFIQAEIPMTSGENIGLEYDTLTTEIRYINRGTGKWETAQNHEYVD